MASYEPALSDDQLRALLPETIHLAYPLINREGERPQTFWLTADLAITLSTGQRVIIPAGFRTDFASVPGILLWLFRAIGDHNLADVLHDWLYTNHMMSRAEADREFLIYMRVLRPHSKSWLDNHLRWLAVRVGGRRAYRNNGRLAKGKGPTGDV